MKRIKMLVVIVIAISSFPVSGQLEYQECVTDSRNSWEWPSNNHWFVADKTGSLQNKGQIISFTGGVFSKTTSPQKIAVYEGVTAISDDNGDLVVYSNGKYAWNAAGVVTSTDIKEGDEMGSLDPTLPGSRQIGSASQGIIAVRHPLTPNKYYIITVGDVIGGFLPAMSYNIFDENGDEIQGNTSLGLKTTEGITSTLHENGVDIWVIVQKQGSPDFYSYLLTCDGFNPPIISGVGRALSGDQARGGLAVSHDGEMLAAGFPGSGVQQVVTYKFNNATGKLSDPDEIAPFNKVVGAYDIIFSKDNSKVIIGAAGFGVQSIDVNTKEHKTGIAPGPDAWNHTIEIGKDGNYYLNGGDGLWRWSGSGAATKVDDASGWGLPTLYIPPAEEPDIEEVGPFCDTAQIIDLHTNWVCSKLSAEDTLYQRHLYKGDGIVDDKLGHFNPAVAGPGLHEIVFTYCNVNDTILIEVKFCPNCRVELEEEHPEICVGESVRLDTMINIANGERIWSIDSFPTTASQS
ncbi:MAG: hypothetical protein P8Q42_02275, partial [Flavobacteriales bacterium]|nr:hypothetical protein [Flavobacteriales bacterium]